MKDKIQQLLQEVRAGKAPTTEKLRRTLTPDDFANFVVMLDDQRQLKQTIKNKPREIQEYEKRLKKALLMHARADVYSLRGKSDVSRALSYKADTLFELCVEQFEELVGTNPAWQLWFDRSPSRSPADNNVSIDPTGVPRIVTSRSMDCRGGGYMGLVRTRRQIIEAVLSSAIESEDTPAAACSINDLKTWLDQKSQKRDVSKLKIEI